MEVKAIMETEQKGIIIPFKKEIDMTFANIANEKAKLIARENAALAYSERCKLNDAPFLTGHSTTIFSKKFY